MRQFPLLLLILLAAASPAFAQAVERDDEPRAKPQDKSRDKGDIVEEHRLFVTPRLGVFVPSLRGSVESGQGTNLDTLFDGTRISLDDDLDIEREGAAYLEIIYASTVKARKVTHFYEHISVTLFYTSLDGEDVLDEAQIFNGTVFPAGSTVDSFFQFAMVGLDYTLHGGAIGSRVEAEVFLGIRYWDLQVSLHAPGVGRTDEDLSLGFLGVGANLRVQIYRWIGVSVRAAGYVSAYGDEDDDVDAAATHYEASLAITVEVWIINIQVGARVIGARAHVLREDSNGGEDLEIGFSFVGPFLDISFRF